MIEVNIKFGNPNGEGIHQYLVERKQPVAIFDGAASAAVISRALEQFVKDQPLGSIQGISIRPITGPVLEV